PGTEQEIFSLEELVSAFDLGRVHKGGAKFDPEKTRWFQHHYLQMMDESILVSQFNQLLSTKGISDTSISANIVPLLKERATFVEDLWEQGSFFYEAPRNYDEKASMKAFKEDTKEILSKALGLMQNVDTFSAENISESIKGWITSNQIGFGKVMMPLRLALVGEMKGPDVFKIAALLGQEEVINRIQAAINFID
ncbi:MAG: glutamate--tRNA ligase, partial [Flavobacteriaceae bacterium]|nr:glutamate--tRNA ligase [Flavobacteriaceae bacterium]